MKVLFTLLLVFLMPIAALAQSKIVRPDELGLTVELDHSEHRPFTREMILITIRGVYRRHITRETLRQPDLEGFSWAQLGADTWAEERIDGKQVKTFERRMAIYPDRPGRLTIGAFTHDLTLTDEGDDWFEHSISSDPLTIEVAAAPAWDGWWFPVRSLRVSDNWSNPPALLTPGEGVLRGRPARGFGRHAGNDAADARTNLALGYDLSASRKAAGRTVTVGPGHLFLLALDDSTDQRYFGDR